MNQDEAAERARRAYLLHEKRRRARRDRPPPLPLVELAGSQCADCAYVDLAACRRSRRGCDGPQHEGVNP